MVLYSNNAKLCYDRIIHSITNLAMQHLKMQEALILSMFKTIQEMDYVIRIVYGDSSSVLSGKNTTIPNEGILQGNGARLFSNDYPHEKTKTRISLDFSNLE